MQRAYGSRFPGRAIIGRTEVRPYKIDRAYGSDRINSGADRFDRDKPWDGKSKNEMVQQDVYI